MKKLILSASFAFALLTTTNTFAQQGFGTNQPDKSAAVDIVSSKRGLLIPRISIADLDQAAPVSNPATSLFVYNTNTTSGEGFYYWDGSKWVRFTSTNNERDVIVQATANGNVDIPAATYDVNGVKTYNVSVKGGAEGQVLVSNATGGTVWTDPNTFVLDVLTAGNAIGIAADPNDPTQVEVKFNGTLSENTTITTGSHDLAITGLEEVNVADLSATDNIVIMGNDGVLKITSRTSLFDAKDLTTDGKIVIVDGADEVNSLADAVLVATELKIAAESITSTDIKNGTIKAEDIYAPNSSTDNNLDGDINQVMVTDENGDVSWINQSDLGNQDSFVGTLPISVTPAAGTNATGGTDYTIAVATATGATLGVVKEAATPTVNINADGELAVNLTNTELDGDVTGPLNATKVEAIQGTAVSATPPDATNNVLKYDGTAWTPAQLQGTDIAGKAITSNSLTVSADGATAALKDVTIEITPGTEGQILTTVNTAAAGDPAVLETDWTTVNSLVEADNGLNKAAGDVIHLGGTLKEVTEIKTSSTNTLAISGLQPATEAATNKVIVSEGTNGILRTVERVITGTNADVATNANYSFFTPEVVLNITLPQTGSDVTVNFPNAASAVGQVINIKIANTDETHSTYLNVLNTYGAMPYQGWIVKSNGSDWVIVGRN